MATKNITLEDFKALSTADGITLVDFWAEWCGPCRVFGPIFEKVSENHSDVTFAKVDTEAEQELAASLGIFSIPTLMIIRDGVVLFQQAGALPERQLESLLAKARELDMEKVRAQAEADAEGDAA